jgi:hypothetical protein
MPPKMRKKWMHERLKDLMSARPKEHRGGAGSDVMDVDGQSPFLSPLTAPPNPSSTKPPVVPPSPMTQELTFIPSFSFTAPSTPLDRQHSPLSGFSRLSLKSPVLASAMSSSENGNTNLGSISPDSVKHNTLWGERNFKHEPEPSPLPSPPSVPDNLAPTH